MFSYCASLQQRKRQPRSMVQAIVYAVADLHRAHPGTEFILNTSRPPVTVAGDEQHDLTM